MSRKTKTRKKPGRKARNCEQHRIILEVPLAVAAQLQHVAKEQGITVAAYLRRLINDKPELQLASERSIIPVNPELARNLVSGGKKRTVIGPQGPRRQIIK
jgi:hypothetical protein